MDGNGTPIAAAGGILGAQWLDTDDESEQGFETFKLAGYGIFSPRESALLFVSGQYKGEDQDDPTKIEATGGFIVGGGDVAQYIQPLAENLAQTNRDELGLNPQYNPDAEDLRRDMLNSYLRFSQGRDERDVAKWMFQLQGGPIVTEDGDDTEVGYKGAAGFWLPLSPNSAVGGVFNISDDNVDQDNIGGGVQFRHGNHGIQLLYDQGKDAQYDENGQETNRVQLQWILRFGK